MNNNKCYARGCDNNNIDCTCMYGNAKEMSCQVNCYNCTNTCKKLNGDIACKHFNLAKENEHMENEVIKTLKIMLANNSIGMENKQEVLEVAIQALKEIQQCRAIGTMDEFKALKEKNEPKKQGNINDYDSHLKLSKAGFLCCSTTNKDIRYPLISLRDLEYCPRCGQKLDWNGDEEYDD